jgi:hypothetical protein
MNEPADLQMPVSQEVLVIMARYPEEGAVKTRLARDLGTQVTHRLYRAFLYDLAEKFGSLCRPLIWYYVPEFSPFLIFLPAALNPVHPCKKGCSGYSRRCSWKVTRGLS